MSIDGIGLLWPLNAQKHCPLFKLPPELRNRIYDMVFNFKHHNGDEPGHVDLAKGYKRNRKSQPDLVGVAPPSVSLVQSCQRIYRETKIISKTAFQAYWKQCFVLDYRGNACDCPYVISTPNTFLERIRKLRLLVRRKEIPFVIDWTWHQGNWEISIEHDGRQEYDESIADRVKKLHVPLAKVDIQHVMLPFTYKPYYFKGSLDGWKLLDIIEPFHRERPCRGIH